MKEIKNPEAYFRTMVKNMDKNEFRSNDNYYKHISSVGNTHDIDVETRKNIQRPAAHSVEDTIVPKDAGDWLATIDDIRLHTALSSLPCKDLHFLFELSFYQFKCSEYALAKGLSKQAVSKKFRRLKEKIKKISKKVVQKAV